MGSSSEDDSEISESEISSYKEKIYEELKTGKYKIKISNDIYKCPFCLGKKKQQHDYKSIMQHSSGIGKGSSNRRAKQKAHHLALAKYIETYLPNESKSFLKDKNVPGPTNSIVKLEPLTKPPQESDQYVWPWTGIIVNLPRPRDDDDDYLKKYYSRFSPLRVHTLWNSRDRIGYAILDFSRDWAGFDNAIAFEKEFESKDHGKKHWKKWRSDPGSRKYGWFARADDYHSEGLIGQHLRQYGELRTFTDITEEATKKTQTLVEFLTEEIAAKNEDIYKWQSRCDETSRSVNMLMEEKDRLQRAHNEEIKRLQRTSRERTKNILFESELMQRDLDSRRRDLEHWSKELNKRESLNEFERRKHEEEKDKSQMKNNELEMASMEQKKADENILRLIESQKREKEAALNKILQLEKKLDAKQKLELEIEELKGIRQVMQHMGGEDGQKLQEQMKKIDEDLKDKMDEMEDLEAMNQTLLVKERKCNDELQEARKALIEFNRESDGSLKSLPSKHVNTGMGFERLTSILQNKMSNYDTDIFMPIFHAIQEATSAAPYSGKIGANDTDKIDMAYRVVADHIRTLLFAIADGSHPDNEGDEYVLRQILRQAVRYGNEVLKAKDGFLSGLVTIVVQVMSDIFPELKQHEVKIRETIADEEESFMKTLAKGLEKFKDVKDLDGKVLRGQTSLGTIICTIVVPGAGIWLGCDSRSVKVPVNDGEPFIVTNDKKMKYQILRVPDGKPPIVGMASGDVHRIKKLWDAIHIKVKDGSDTIIKVVDEVMLHLRNNPHPEHSCRVLLAGFNNEQKDFLVVKMGDRMKAQYYPSSEAHPEYQVGAGSGLKFAQKSLFEWNSERTKINDIDPPREKALQLIKSAMMAAVTNDFCCGGNMNVLWLTNKDVKVTAYTALDLLMENCGTKLDLLVENCGTKLDPSHYFFFTQEHAVINCKRLAKLLKPYGFQNKDAIFNLGTVVDDVWAMFCLKVREEGKFEQDCISLGKSILRQVTLVNYKNKSKHKFYVIQAKYLYMYK